MSNDRDSYTGPLFRSAVGEGFHPPYQPHSRTSLAAARSLTPGWLSGKRLEVWSVLRHAMDGLTDEDGIRLTNLSPSSYRPRRVELVEAGLVEDTGHTRPGVSGRAMTVWRAKG